METQRESQEYESLGVSGLAISLKLGSMVVRASLKDAMESDSPGVVKGILHFLTMDSAMAMESARLEKVQQGSSYLEQSAHSTDVKYRGRIMEILSATARVVTVGGIPTPYIVADVVLEVGDGFPIDLTIAIPRCDSVSVGEYLEGSAYPLFVPAE